MLKVHCFAMQARQALEVVSSLVQDLAPPDSAARPPKPSDAGDSNSRKAQLQHDSAAPGHTGQVPGAGIPDAEPEASPTEEKPPVRKVCSHQLYVTWLRIGMLARMDCTGPPDVTLSAQPICQHQRAATVPLHSL